jgi:hypothetical protein
MTEHPRRTYTGEPILAPNRRSRKHRHRNARRSENRNSVALTISHANRRAYSRLE